MVAKIIKRTTNLYQVNRYDVLINGAKIPVDDYIINGNVVEFKYDVGMVHYIDIIGKDLDYRVKFRNGLYIANGTTVEIKKKVWKEYKFLTYAKARFFLNTIPSENRREGIFELKNGKGDKYYLISVEEDYEVHQP